jgi:hypothetical protein
MKVASTSPDTGQQGGFALSKTDIAHAPAGKQVRALCFDAYLNEKNLLLA